MIKEKHTKWIFKPFERQSEIYGNSSAVPPSLIHHHMPFASENQVKPRGKEPTS